ncbi:MAG: YhfC family glutamic-type intramembrane protease [Anaerolineales bacterium]
MVGMPVGLAIYLSDRWKLGGRIWWIGAATFVLSQTGHIPFNWVVGKVLNQTGMVAWDPTYQLIFNAVFLGVSAGIFEEGARYIVLRCWAKEVRSWRKGVLFGAGHGGAEAIILGAITLYAFLQLIAIKDADLSKLFPASQLALAQRQVQAYWSATWYASMLGALERFFTIPCQIAMAVMVTQVFVRRNIGWLLAAISYHALLDGVAVVGQKYINPLGLEGMIGIFAILSVAIIFLLRQPEPLEAISPVEPAADVSQIEPVQETSENMEKTRYQ